MTTKRQRFTKPQLIIIIVIILCMLSVITAVIYNLFSKPENIVKAKISEISSDYYENYLYKNFNFEKYSSEDFANFMQKYENVGLTTTTLRQLLLYDHQKNADVAPLLEKYCDENTTFIKFYPEQPYSKTSYRVEYTYSCEF